jgi:hypothetical protein
MAAMIPPWIVQYGSYVGWLLLIVALYLFTQYQKKKWTTEYNMIFYSDIRDIKLYRFYVQSIETDTSYHENVEVTVYGRGIFIRNPYHDVPLVKFKTDNIDEVHIKPNEVKVVSNFDYAIVNKLIVRSDSPEELTDFARNVQTLMRLHKRKNRKLDPLLKRKHLP